MFSHIFTSVNDFEKAYAFYSALMRIFGNELRFIERGKPWAGLHSEGGKRPYFVICKPYDGNPHNPGNGQMVAFNSGSRQQVREAYQAAMSNGGTCEGPPSLRPQYHAEYFGAYFRDLDGNKICVASHSPEVDN